MEYWWTATPIHSVPLLAVQGFLPSPTLLKGGFSPYVRGLSPGALISPQNILVTSSQRPLTQLNIQIWSPGATRQLPTALAPRPDFHLGDQEGEKNTGSSWWNISSRLEDVQNHQSTSAMNQAPASFQVSVCFKPLHPLKKAKECAIHCKHKYMSLGMFSHAARIS